MTNDQIRALIRNLSCPSGYRFTASARFLDTGSTQEPVGLIASDTLACPLGSVPHCAYPVDTVELLVDL